MQRQQQVAEATERRNRLALLVDDYKREVHLLESKAIDATDKVAKLQLELEVRAIRGSEAQAESLQHRHWENLTRGEVERYNLLLQEYNAMKEDHRKLFVRYMDVKSDNDRLQRQVSDLTPL